MHPLFLYSTEYIKILTVNFEFIILILEYFLLKHILY